MNVRHVDRGLGIASAVVTAGTGATQFVKSTEHLNAEQRLNGLKFDLKAYGDLGPAEQLYAQRRIGNGTVTTTVSYPKSVGYNVAKMQEEGIKVLTETGNRLSKDAVNALTKGDTRALSTISSTSSRRVLEAQKKIEFHAENVAVALKKVDETAKAIETEEAALTRMRRWANVHPAMAVISAGGMALHTGLAINRFQNGKVAAGIAHAVAAAGQGALTAQALVSRSAHFGNIGIVVATGAAITAAAIDS